jgi:hypothetical protein
MKSLSRTRDVALQEPTDTLSSRLQEWAQSLYDKAHDPSHCARCGVYLPARDRICEPCAREG